MQTTQTTLRFPDAFIRKAKAFSAKEGITLTEFFFQAGEIHMHPKPAAKKKKIVLPVYKDKPGFVLDRKTIREIEDSFDEAELKKAGLI